LIKAVQLNHSFENGRKILSNVSFEINPGEKVVLLGVNGCGKTTLLQILNGLIFPSSGSYHYKGTEVTRSAFRDNQFNYTFRREVVLLFQNPEAMIFNPTVYDELAFGPRQFGMQDVDGRVRHWADVLNVSTLLDRPPFDLSSGEKQRVCLASLLCLEPELLLLDEPAASLDPRSTGWLVDFLSELEVAILVTTHNISMAGELGERTLVLSEDHEIIYDGSIESFLEDREKLLGANLLHTHRHRHGDLEHGHYHIHDWE